jgi:hypothetical protein
MFAVNEIVPWGRSFDEYRRMFALDGTDLQRRILGCADGPASFNAEATRRGTAVVSCDPLYRADTDRIRERVHATSAQVLDQTRRNAHAFVWDTIQSVEELGRIRMAAMERFLEDYGAGKREGRYVDAGLPALPFPAASFDLAVCSHFLFLYTDHLTDAFHLAAIREMCRVASEARIFPLVTLDGERSPYVEAIIDRLRALGYEASIETVPYEFQRGANQMMRVRAAEQPEAHVGSSGVA